MKASRIKMWVWEQSVLVLLLGVSVWAKVAQLVTAGTATWRTVTLVVAGAVLVLYGQKSRSIGQRQSEKNVELGVADAPIECASRKTSVGIIVQVLGVFVGFATASHWTDLLFVAYATGYTPIWRDRIYPPIRKRRHAVDAGEQFNDEPHICGAKHASGLVCDKAVHSLEERGVESPHGAGTTSDVGLLFWRKPDGALLDVTGEAYLYAPGDALNNSMCWFKNQFRPSQDDPHLFDDTYSEDEGEAFGMITSPTAQGSNHPVVFVHQEDERCRSLTEAEMQRAEQRLVTQREAAKRSSESALPSGRSVIDAIAGSIGKE